MTNVWKLAAGWAAAYGTLAAGWTVAGRGFPFGTADPHRGGSTLRDLDPAAGAPVFAGVLLLTAAALVMLHRGDRLRRPLLGWVWTVAAVLLVVVPDVRLLTLAGYLPMLIIGFPFGWPPVDYSEVFTWALANQVIAFAGGLLLAVTALRRQRSTAGLCVTCGRGDEPGRWTSRTAAARWGRVVTWVAALIPASYAVVRLAWLAGIPLGISRGFLHEMQDTGLVWAGGGLAAFALVGTVLTTGLIRPWGEHFPRWMIGLAGRPVPIRLATVPATLVALFVTSASVAFLGTGGLMKAVHGELDGAALPILLWPFWGVSLGSAAWAYHLRRRPACRDCGRDDAREAGAGLVPEPATRAY